MANIANNLYDVTLSIESFYGLYQDGDSHNIDPRYAAEAVNVDTAGGMLQTAARHTRLLPELPGPIGTLANLHRRWHTEDNARDVFVAASGGRLYWMLPDGAAWRPIEPPEGVEAFQSDAWSWVTYEINPEGSEAPVDVLLLSNADDGMICVRGDTMTASAVETPKRFGVIARYAERIWGGAIRDDPDMLVYSAPFDPFDWTHNTEHPADGAGDVQQPSWDGDSFTAIVQFGAQLIALKKWRVWRILGTDPGQYVFKEQYGGGARYFSTVVPVGERLLMLGPDGLLQYDGLAVQPYYPQYARNVFRRVNEAAVDAACACFYKDRYYCALPLDGSRVNNAVLVFDTVYKTWLLRDGFTVAAFLPTDGGLYFTSATEPGRVFRWGEDPWSSGADHCRWVSPWLDMGQKQNRYGGWTVYYTLECAYPVSLTVTIETEKRARSKTHRAEPLHTGERYAKQKRLTFGGSGRRWRFIIESDDGMPWALPGGMEITAEKDPD